MTIFSHAKEGSWVMVPRGADKGCLMRRFLDCDMLISDLDGTDAPMNFLHLFLEDLVFMRLMDYEFISSSIRIAYEGISSRRIGWQAKIGHNYVDRYLDTKEGRVRAARRFTQSYISASVYPHVEEFYSLLPNSMQKICLSENIEPIVKPFSRYLGFEKALCCRDKQGALEQLILENPQLRRIAIKADYCTDEPMLDVLDHYRKIGVLEDYIGIYVAGTPRGCNARFEMNISRDHAAMNRLMRGARQYDG